MRETFTGVLLTERDGQVQAKIQSLQATDLPQGDVLVEVAYSALNYKDALALTGRNKVVRSYPMVPGIDFAGTVAESNAPDYQQGDRVVLTGWGVGERHWGGYAQLARVQSGWLVPIPEGLSLQDAAGIGTAGLTAMLSLMALEEHDLAPSEREVLVTGAGGGVGGMAVALLGHLGYHVVAASRRAELHEYLRELGARDVVNTNELTAPGGPLGSARWAWAIDTVGGETLAGVLRTVAYGACVAACGNAGGIELHTTILPFILRGVSLLGINSLPTPLVRRRVAWARLAHELPREALRRMTRVEPLSRLPELAQQLLRGEVQGRIVVDVNA